MSFAVAMKDVFFSYEEDKPVIQMPSLEVKAGQRIFVHGPSGSGKSTLLGLMTGILQPKRGSVEILGRDLMSMRGGERDRFRGDHCGYIFQMFNLIPYLSTAENIGLVCRLSKARRQRLKKDLDSEIKELADQLDVANLLDKPVTHLSIGQQQRVAAARAFLGYPPLIIADEPTSALDHDNREEFIKTLFRIQKDHGSTIIFVSHDHTLKPLFDEALSLAAMNKAGGG